MRALKCGDYEGDDIKGDKNKDDDNEGIVLILTWAVRSGSARG